MDIQIIRVKGKTRNAFLKEIANGAVYHGLASNKQLLYEALIAREKEGTTAFENGMAIPHARIPSINQTSIIVARAQQGVHWQSLDGMPTDCAIALLVRADETAGEEHMKYLAALASLLMSSENVGIFKKGSKSELLHLLEGAVKSGQSEPVIGSVSEQGGNASDHYDFVAVTSCPTGVAHTNMAAEALERFAKQNNLKIKVERQAAQGTVNPLSEQDMAKTDHVILAIGRNIEGKERFAGKHVLEVGVGAPLKDAAKLWADVKQAPVQGGHVPSGNQDGSIYSGFSNTTKGFPADKEKIHLMRAVMTGLSYMIPVVIVGGIFLVVFENPE